MQLLLPAIFTSSAAMSSSLTTSLAVQFYNPNSLTCEGPLSLIILGVTGSCFTLPSLPEASFQYNCSHEQWTAYNAPNSCTTPGTGVTEATDQCEALADIPGSQIRNCFVVETSSIFNVTYYTDSSCSAGAVMYAGLDGLLGTGIVNQCLGATNVNGTLYYLKSAQHGNVLTTTFFSDPNCEQVIGSFQSQGGGVCNTVQNPSANLANYYTVSLPLIPLFLTGQVNLNAGAISLNGQIAGASVAIICGVTALVVIVSMLGFL
jgi:hypothetical protein